MVTNSALVMVVRRSRALRLSVVDDDMIPSAAVDESSYATATLLAVMPPDARSSVGGRSGCEGATGA